MSASALLAAIQLYVSTCHPAVSTCAWKDDITYFQCQTTLAQQRDACKNADAALVKISATK